MPRTTGASASFCSTALLEVLDELSQLTLSVSSPAPEVQEVIDAATEAMNAQNTVVHGIFDIHLANNDGSEHAWNNKDYPLTVRIPMTEEMKALHAQGSLAFAFCAMGIAAALLGRRMLRKNVQ